jgi:hypothetical protein
MSHQDMIHSLLAYSSHLSCIYLSVGVLTSFIGICTTVKDQSSSCFSFVFFQNFVVWVWSFFFPCPYVVVCFSFYCGVRLFQIDITTLTYYRFKCQYFKFGEMSAQSLWFDFIHIGIFLFHDINMSSINFLVDSSFNFKF